MNFDLDTDQRDAAAGARAVLHRVGLRRPPPAPRSRAARRARAARRWPTSASSASPSPRTPAARAARCSTSPSSPSRAGAVLAGPSLVTAARAAVLLADVPELAAALADGSTALRRRSTGRRPSIDAASADVVPRAGGRRPGRRRRRGHRRRADRRHPRAGVGAAHRPAGAAPRTPASCWARARQVAAVVLAAEGLGAADRAVQLGRRLREGAAGVRPADRLVPGGQAHAGRRVGRAWTSCARWCGGRPGRPTTRRTSSRWRRPRRRPTRREVFEQAAETRDPGARRHRLHLGARRAPVLAAGEGRPAAARATRPSTSTPSPRLARRRWCAQRR